MICPACNTHNEPGFEECFVCGKALFALTQGSVLAQRYEIRRLVGHGGMGRVYEAQDRVLEERVAIKVLRPQFAREPDMARRFLSEVRLARRITHPNVCRLHEYGESEGIRYLCMELVDGINLKDVLRQRRLPESEAYDVSIAAAEGLAAVHAQDVIHRDFKTANIMLDARGQVKVMDFGIAKELGSESTGISMAGHVLGTPEYMSPEHAQGGRLDFRSDIYALGCVVFEIFTGRTIFSGGNPIETLRRHLYEPLPLGEEAAPALPEPLRPVLERALAKKPEDRHGSVREFIEDLGAARAESPLLAVLQDDAELPELPPVRPAPRASLPLPPPATAAPAGDTRLLTPGPRPLPPRRRSWPWWAAAAAIAVGIALVRLADGPEPVAIPVSTASPMTLAAPPSPVPTASPEPVETPQPEATPAVAAVAPEPTRPVHRALPVATREPVRLVPAGSPPPAAAPTPVPPTLAAAVATPPAPRAAPSVVGTGVLNLLIVPPSEVTVGADALGETSARELRLPEGEYVVRIVHPEYHPLQRKMTVRTGATTDLVIDLSEKGVRR